jgi:hypothetical protein
MPVSVANALGIIEYASTQLGAMPLAFQIHDNDTANTFYVALWDMTDEKLAGLADVTVTAYAGPGSFKDDYSLGGEPAPVGTIFSYIAADGAWSPHYNAATAPTATYDPVLDRTLYAYEAGEVGTLRQRKAMVVEIDGTTVRTAFAGDENTLNGDDHGVPSIVTHPTTGRAYVFYGSHNNINGSTAQQYSVEVTPGSLDFAEQTGWAFGAGLANNGTTPIVLSYGYPHPMFVGTDLWVSFRHCYGDNGVTFYGNPITKMTLAIRKATGFTAGGVPTGFDPIIELIDCGDLNGIDGFGGGSRVYHGQNIVRDGEIYIPVSITDSGDANRRQPGVVVYNPTTGTLRNVQNTWSTTTLPINYATYKANCAHRQQTGSEYSSSGALAFDNAGNLHHVYRWGTSTGSLTFYQRIWNGTTLSAEVSTGVTVDNEFDHMAIAPQGVDGLEALYTQDPLAAYAREGEVWRKTWTPGGGWTAGAMILDDEAGRPGRGRPMDVYGKAGEWVMAEKSSGTTGAPGSALYGQHRCWFYRDGAFVSRLVQDPPAQTAWAGAGVRAGAASGAFVGYVPIVGDSDDPFPVLSLVDNAGGQFALSDDGRREFPNIVTTATAATEGSKTLTLNAVNRFGLTTSFTVPVVVRSAATFEPEDLSGTKAVFRTTEITRAGVNATGSFVQASANDLTYRLVSRNNVITSNERFQAGSTTVLTRWLPLRNEGGRGYILIDTDRDVAASYAAGNFTTNAAWLMAFCVRVDGAGTAATPSLFANGSPGTIARFSLYYHRASGEWRFQIGTTTVALAGAVDVDQVVMVGQTSAGDIVLRVGSNETTATSFNTVTGGTSISVLGISGNAATFFRGRFYSAVIVRDACPDETARGNLAAWLATS